MPYSQFTTIAKVKEAFGLTIVERSRFLPQTEPIQPSATLADSLRRSLPSVATGSEKARSEGIIYPVLLEVNQITEQQVSLFSGEDFTVDTNKGLNGIVDFLLSRSPEVLEIEAPVIVLVEAKRAEIKPGFGQCIAEMVAAQQFNQARGLTQPTYGSVTSGTQWRFLKLEGTTVQIDLTDYPLPPVETILGILTWMTQAH